MKLIRMRLGRPIYGVLAVFLLLARGAPPRSALPFPTERVLLEWRFDTPGALRGWTAGGHVRNTQVADGALRGVTTDGDPLLLSPTFEIAARPTQCVEIKLRTARAGEAQLFWTETLEGLYGGFSERKSNRFTTRSDGAFHVYRVYPFWHAAGKIVRLRLDPPATGAFALAWLRIAATAAPQPSPARAWRFTSDSQGWRPWQDVSELTVRAGNLHFETRGNQPLLMSPLLAVPAAENPFVIVRMAVNRGTSGRVLGVSRSQYGAGEVSFPLRGDGKLHSYLIDMGQVDHWQDEIILLGVQPTDTADAEVTLASVEIADEPRGPAELEAAYFGPTAGVNRVGRPAGITLQVRNRGGAVARNVTATLTVPEGVRLAGSAVQRLEPLTYWRPQSVTWQVAATRPGPAALSARLESETAPPLTARTTVTFTPVPAVPKSDYLPAPQPVTSPYEIGTFYFPGWPTMSRWRPILDYPGRKPVLGWYDEANPECADWQIKWAVEHGITFFLVDWYWCAGRRQLDHWLHQACRHARFRRYLKWAVMWANHNPPHTHSVEDWRAVTRYWIEHYFHQPEYYRIAGRPAVFIWLPSNIRRDVGGSEQAARLYAMAQQMAREAGLPGIYFVAMSDHRTQAQCRQLQAEGYEAFTSYHAFELAAERAGTKRFPFADVVETSPEVWRRADERASGLRYFPLVETGWSPEPWHGDRSLVITDRTPEQFGRLCRAARTYAERTKKRILILGPWNEWGEGSYIEPCAEFGFDCLDQLRATFCPPGDWPPNLVPADLGRGPYDLPPQPFRSAREFNTDGDFAGWTPNGALEVGVHRNPQRLGPTCTSAGVSSNSSSCSTLCRKSLRTCGSVNAVP